MKLLIVSCLVALTYADKIAPAPAPGSYQQPAGYGQRFEILSQENVHPGDGTYQFSFQTENGISRNENGNPKGGYGKSEYGQPTGGYVQQGGWSYSDGYGNPIQLTFVADENGYQPASNILPTPVPTEYPVPVVPQVYHGEQSYGLAPAPAPARYSAPASAQYNAPVPASVRHSVPAPAPSRYSAPAPARYNAPAPPPAQHNAPVLAPAITPAGYSAPVATPGSHN